MGTRTQSTMPALIYRGPGTVAVEEVPVPTPREGEALIEVASVGICGSDLLLRDGGFSRVVPPVIVGHEFGGTVVAAPGHGDLEGTRVAVEPLLNCGACHACREGAYNVCSRLRLFGIDLNGGAASYAVVPIQRLHALPARVTLRGAALAEPTAVAVHMRRISDARSLDRVLIVGGGPIGALIAAVLMATGVASVTIYELSEPRRELLTAMGLVALAPPVDVGEDFDVAFDLTGVAAGLATAVGAVRPRGTVLLGGIPHGDIAFPGAQATLKELTLRGSRTYTSTDFDDALALLATPGFSGQQIVTTTVPLANAVAGAFDALASSRDAMKILVTPTSPDPQ